MSRRGVKTFLAVAVALVVAAALLPAEASAQCALCRTALQGAAEKTARTMNLGIVMLLVPPVAIFCTIFAVALRSGRGGKENDG